MFCVIVLFILVLFIFCFKFLFYFILLTFLGDSPFYSVTCCIFMYREVNKVLHCTLLLWNLRLRAQLGCCFFLVEVKPATFW